MDDIRLDKYLWAVRVFKTRSDAADAIRNNKVTVNGSAAKPSREVKVGDVIAVRKMQVTYSSASAARTTNSRTIRPAANPFTKNNTAMDDIRLDKYLWAVRVFKTRSDAADAIRNNKVTVNGSAAKPSREVKVGDVIAVRKMQVTYSYRVLDLVSSRQPAKNVPLYCLNITPQEELDKLSIPRETIFVFRDRGTGRPTKKERRELDGLMDGIYYDGDE